MYIIQFVFLIFSLLILILSHLSLYSKFKSHTIINIINPKTFNFFIIHFVYNRDFPHFFIICQKLISQNQQMDPSSSNFKSVIKVLEVVIKFEKNEQSKLQCMDVLQRFIESRNTAILKQLNKSQQLSLIEIRTVLKCFKNAFLKVVQKQPYKGFQLPNDTIIQFLFSLQEKIDPSDLRTSYLRAITVNKKKFNWSKEFIQEWFNTYDLLKADQQERFKQKYSTKVQQQKKSQKIPVIVQPEAQKRLLRSEQQKICHWLVHTNLQDKEIAASKVKAQKQKEKQPEKQKVEAQNKEKRVKKEKKIRKSFKTKKQLLRYVVQLDSKLDEYVIEVEEEEKK